MGTARDFRTEFPDYDPATLPALPEGFIDQSWRNEMCPRFVNEALGLELWCDFARRADREHEEGGRFLLRTFNPADPGSPGEDLVDDDDFVFISDFLDEVAAGSSLDAAARTMRFRSNKTTVEDAKIILAEEGEAERPCPDLMAELRAIIGVVPA